MNVYCTHNARMSPSSCRVSNSEVTGELLLVWRDYEDFLAPHLNFSNNDRVVYSHLLRHSRLEGKTRFPFTMPWLARGTGLCRMTVRQAVRRLIARGVVDLIERNTQTGYLVRVRLPQELRAVRAARIAASRPAPPPRDPLSIEHRISCKPRFCAGPSTNASAATAFTACAASATADAAWTTLCHAPFLAAIPTATSSLAVWIAKKDRSAEEHLRWLFRERRLSVTELNGRLRALDELAAGKLVPPLPGQGNKESEADKAS